MTMRTVKVDYLTRVEGETAIKVELPGREGANVELKIFEPPRFFEGFLAGRRYDEVGDIVSRICGICPVSHMTTAIRAIEKATGIEPSGQTQALRRIGAAAQIAASHLVHLYALVMPDYAGCQGLPDLVPARPEDAQRLVRMRKVVNDLTTLVYGGRALHPVGAIPGGFTRIPEKQALDEMVQRLVEIRPEAAALIDTFAALDIPDFERSREFLALDSGGNGYALNTGRIVSTGGFSCGEDEYGDEIHEAQVPYAMALRLSLPNGNGPMVGALARLHIKSGRLAPAVGDLARQAGLGQPDNNPFHNILGQAVEIAQCIEICVDELAELEPKPEEPAGPTRGGYGAAITEAPRGLLYHAYQVNRKGTVEKARIITPTVHNFLSLEQDLRALVEQEYEREDDEIRRLCEMLVRAYDPCFSCSVH